MLSATVEVPARRGLEYESLGGGHCQGKGRLHRRGVILTILNSFYQAEDWDRIFHPEGIACVSVLGIKQQKSSSSETLVVGEERALGDGFGPEPGNIVDGSIK